MTPAALLREALRNIITGTTRTVIFSVVLSMVSVGLVAADLVTVRAIISAAENYQRSGASVLTLSAEERIDAAACEALNAVPGVRAAGALRVADNGITAGALPSTTVPVLEVTQSFPELLHAKTSVQAGIILSDQAARSLSLDVGDTLIARSGKVPVSGIYEYPDDGRRPGYGYTALTPVPAEGSFDECWADFWPVSTQAPALLQSTLLPGSEDIEQEVLSQLNTTLGTTFDGDERFANRITRFSALIALVAGLILGYVFVRFRRVELASALHAGVRKRNLAVILGVEVASWAIPTLVFTVVITAFFVATGASGDFTATLFLGARTGVLACVSPFFGSLLALSLTRERHLFRYFKDR